MVESVCNNTHNVLDLYAKWTQIFMLPVAVDRDLRENSKSPIYILGSRRGNANHEIDAS